MGWRVKGNLDEASPGGLAARETGTADGIRRPASVKLRSAVAWTLLCGITLIVALVGIALAVAGFPGVRRDGEITAATLFELVKIALALVAGIGGAVALVVAYRRQQINEVADERAHGADLRAAEEAVRGAVRLYNERYDRACAQLGSDKAAVRLGGVYALAGLADDWEEGRQTCIDVLCAYVRMPYEIPAEDREDSQTASTDLISAQLGLKQERQVRHTVFRVVAQHLRNGNPQSWQGQDLDFTGAVIDGADFSGAVFKGNVSFAHANFAGNATTSFNDTEFGGHISFDDAVFTDGRINFDRARFSAGELTMYGARFVNANVSFESAEFSGMFVRMHFMEIEGGKILFAMTRFVGETVSFLRTRLTDGVLSFNDAKFLGGKVHFNETHFDGGQLRFDGATVDGANVVFNLAGFHGSNVTFRNCRFISGHLRFGGAHFAGGNVTFAETQFGGVEIRFNRARFDGGVVELPPIDTCAVPPVFDDALDPESPPDGLRFTAAKFVERNALEEFTAAVRAMTLGTS
jgi:uncharacterized protein YjbI with pentapeptide repeats